MTPLHTAARADQQQPWTDQPWKMQVGDSKSAQRQSWQNICLNLFHTLAGFIHSGWKWLERKRVQHVSSRRLRLTETISLGEKRSVSIIEVDGLQYLIGSSAGSVQLLTVLEKQAGGDLRRTEARAS